MNAVLEQDAPPIRAQPGPQFYALSCGADFVIFGGAAGGGKTWGLFLSVLQYAGVPTFGAEIFRRTTADITKTGALWDESYEVFPRAGGEPNQGLHRWRFPSGATCTFSHIEHPADRFHWKGAQIGLLGFDQLESFTEEQFWYLTTRLRDPSGALRPWVFATCNPVPDDDPVGGWLRKLIDWWINPVTGLALESRSGVLRWFVRTEEGAIEWHATYAAAYASRHVARYRAGLMQMGKSAEEAEAQARLLPKSFTFIESRLEDNPALEAKSPGYRATLEANPLVERERLLGRNWNVRPAAGLVFNRVWFDTVEAAPVEARRVRYWDKAGTEDAGKYSAGVRLAYDDVRGLTYVEDVVRGQWSALHRERVIRQTAEADGYDVEIWEEQEPGSGGKESAEATIRNLAGWSIRADRVTGPKVARAGPFSAQAEAGNVKLVRGAWNEAFLREYHAFTGAPGQVCDQVDAGAGAYNKLARSSAPGVRVAGAAADADSRVTFRVRSGEKREA